MAPHAESPPRSSKGREVRGEMADVTIHQLNQTDYADSEPSHHSLLSKTSSSELHDLVCIGFGPAALAIAAALHDGLEYDGNLSFLDSRRPKVCFLERQPHFAWHAGMQLPGAKMQITFMKDLATFRNPRSQFTFVNYLFRKGRLAQFTNLSTFLPLRSEYEDYMRWCSTSFSDVVEYSQEALEVIPEYPPQDIAPCQSFKVVTRNTITDRIEIRRARHVVIAVGGKPKMPRFHPRFHPRLIHSSHYASSISDILPTHESPYQIAVVGAGQSATEVFVDLHSRYPNSHTKLLIRSGALRPSDDSPFVNEIFDPSRVTDTYDTPHTTRASDIHLDHSTNYSVVRLSLLEHLYASLYEQSIRYPDPLDHAHRILPYRHITSISDVPAASPSTNLNAKNPPRLRLHVRNESGLHNKTAAATTETHDVDAVIIASGYEHNAHEDLLAPAAHLRASTDDDDDDDDGKKWHVERDYRVRFAEGAVAPHAGVWLQGCNEATHGLSDTLLSILAPRAGELVRSIFGEGRICVSDA